MKMTINSRAKRRWILASLILALVLAIVGLFFIQKERKTEITASAENTTFAMKDGMSLSVEPNDARIRFIVYLTEDMYDKLTEETEESSFLFWTSYDPSDYYLQIVRHEVGTSVSTGVGTSVSAQEINPSGCATMLYHIDPEHSKYSATEYSGRGENSTYGGKYAGLSFPFSTDYAKEYNYTCRFLKSVEIEDTLHGESYS